MQHAILSASILTQSPPVHNCPQTPEWSISISVLRSNLSVAQEQQKALKLCDCMYGCYGSLVNNDLTLKAKTNNYTSEHWQDYSDHSWRRGCQPLKYNIIYRLLATVYHSTAATWRRSICTARRACALNSTNLVYNTTCQCARRFHVTSRL